MRRLRAGATAFLLLGLVAPLALAGSAGPVDYPQVWNAMEHKQARDILVRWEAAYAAAKKPMFAPTFGLETELVGPGVIEKHQGDHVRAHVRATSGRPDRSERAALAERDHEVGRHVDGRPDPRRASGGEPSPGDDMP